MPLTTIDEPGMVDAFGVRFSMDDRGTVVRCHVFRAAIEALDDLPAHTEQELLARFQRGRAVFERLAGAMYDAGHVNPWIEALPG